MKVYFLCSSVTYAIKGKKLIKAEGIGSAVRRSPENMGSKGCGYILEIHDKEARRALRLLNENDVPYKGIFLDDEKGYREVTADDLP